MPELLLETTNYCWKVLLQNPGPLQHPAAPRVRVLPELLLELLLELLDLHLEL